MINVLVFPCGSEIGLEIHRSLKYSKNIKLFGSSSISDHGKYVFENYSEGLPYISDDTFIDELNKIIIQNDINYVLPAHDDLVLKLAKEKDKLKCDYIGSPHKTVDICRSKLKTYNYFKNIINVPKVFKINEIKDKDFPLFLKPEIGQGSKGCVLVKNKEELNFNTNKCKDLLILEYLPGFEYTVDCFSDSRGNLKFVGSRKRHRILNGISSNSFEVADKKFENIANKINDSLDFKGSWFFQVKENVEGELSLLEIAPRIAGTMALYRNKGVNFPLLSILDKQYPNLDLIVNDYFISLDRCFQNKYQIELKYSQVWVDFDDTLIIDGKINTQLIGFLYECLNNGKSINLITKHKHNIKDSLYKYKINLDLFDQIVHLDSHEDKSKYIGSDSIFIDDSFSERKIVSDKCNIPVFDVDMVEALIDHKK